jgi:multiple sugar transport system ATP-binding protein
VELRFEQVSKKFDQAPVLSDFTLDIPDATFLVLLGPSGCGKTTAMRIAAGLEQPTSGRVFIGDRDVTGIPPRARDVAMVFQSYALYPHLKVWENIGYPLRIRRVPKAQIRAEVARVAESLGLSDHLERKPRHLSGGQRQRVALARAIIRHPAAFLMDEPLSNLDAQLRVQMRTEIKTLQRELGITTLYVTHDQVEAMTMADQIAVLRNGVLQQLARPLDLYSTPANTFVAQFVGSPAMNIVKGTVQDGTFRCIAGTLAVPPGVPPGDVLLGFRPESADPIGPAASAASASPADHLRLQVYAVEPLGNEMIAAFRFGDELLNARVEPDAPVSVGQNCRIFVPPEQMHFFDTDTRQRIRLPVLPEHSSPLPDSRRRYDPYQRKPIAVVAPLGAERRRHWRSRGGHRSAARGLWRFEGIRRQQQEDRDRQLPGSGHAAVPPHLREAVPEGNRHPGRLRGDQLRGLVPGCQERWPQ